MSHTDVNSPRLRSGNNLPDKQPPRRWNQGNSTPDRQSVGGAVQKRRVPPLNAILHDSSPVIADLKGKLWVGVRGYLRWATQGARVEYWKTFSCGCMAILLLDLLPNENDLEEEYSALLDGQAFLGRLDVPFKEWIEPFLIDVLTMLRPRVYPLLPFLSCPELSKFIEIDIKTAAGKSWVKKWDGAENAFEPPEFASFYWLFIEERQQHVADGTITAFEQALLSKLALIFIDDSQHTIVKDEIFTELQNQSRAYCNAVISKVFDEGWA